MKQGALLVLFLTSIFLAGCGKTAPSDSNPNRTACIESNYFISKTDIVEGRNGYYVLRDSFNGSYLSYMSRQDLSNETFLCAKPDCKHMNDIYGTMYKDCNSYLGGEAIPMSIKCYEGSIYVLLHEGGEAVLYRIKDDGSQHDRLFPIGRLSGTMSHVYNYIVHENEVYVCFSGEGYKENEMREISRFSLKDGKKEVLLQENAYYLDAIKLYGSSLYFRKTNRDGTESTISRYNFDTGKIEDLAGNAISFYTIDDKGNSIWYWRMGEGLINYDLATGQQRLIRKSDDSMVNAWLACNGKYVVLDNQAGNYMDPEGEHILEIIDIAQEKVVASVACPSEITSVFNCDGERLLAESDSLDAYCYIDLQDVADGKAVTWKYLEPF